MSVTNILTKSPLELEESLGISASEVLKLIKKTAESVPQPIYGACIKQTELKLSTGDSMLDRVFGGGLIANGITEICGESASGKTQLCLQLSIMAQMPKEKGGLEAEDAFPDKRLCQMASSSKFPVIPGHNVLDHIFIEHAADVACLLSCLEHRLPELMKRRPVGLVIIDSIAGAVRGDDSLLENKNQRPNQQQQVSLAVGQLAARLHALLAGFHVHLVCVNQVSDIFQDNPVKLASGIDQKHTSALGLFWANQVCTRIMLSRTLATVPMSVRNGNSLTPNADCIQMTIRRLTVQFAPHLPPCWISFVVDMNGVRGWEH